MDWEFSKRAHELKVAVLWRYVCLSSLLNMEFENEDEDMVVRVETSKAYKVMRSRGLSSGQATQYLSHGRREIFRQLRLASLFRKDRNYSHARSCVIAAQQMQIKCLPQ